MRFRACRRAPAKTALRPFGPARYPTHRKGSLRSAARAAAPSLAAGRGHGLASFAFRLAAPAGPGSAYPLGAPPPRRGTPLRAPLDGGTVSGEAVHLFQPGAPLRWGAGSAPTFDRRLGATISARAEIQKRLPRARRRGLLVPGLDGQTPTSWAPAASSAVLRWLPWPCWPASQGRPISMPRGHRNGLLIRKGIGVKSSTNLLLKKERNN